MTKHLDVNLINGIALAFEEMLFIPCAFAVT